MLKWRTTVARVEMTELVEAAKDGDLREVERLIEIGADVNLKDEFYMTALIWAAENGHLEIAEILLDNGADVNAQNDYHDYGNDYGSTSLIRAAHHGHVEIVQLLTDNGADIEAQDNGGGTGTLEASGPMGCCAGRDAQIWYDAFDRESSSLVEDDVERACDVRECPPACAGVNRNRQQGWIPPA